MVDIAPDADKFKILYLSNAPHCPSGYGNQTAGNCYDWNKIYDVRVLANYGIQGAQIALNGLPIYACLTGDDHGNRSADLIFKQSSWKPDLFITLYDIWMGAYVTGMPPQPLKPIHPFWVPIIMIDHEPVPEATVISAKAAYKCVSPTKWGTEQLISHGVERSHYIPFGIDRDVWRPSRDNGEKRKDKKWLSERVIPFNLSDHLKIDGDSFLIHINGANKDPYRKAFMRMFTAIQIFLQNNPDAAKDTRVYVHSWMRMARDIPHGAKVLHIDRYCSASTDYHMLQSVPEQAMARISRASDVFFHLSEGGGFEIPIMEALSTGTPVIAQDFVANGELVGDGGWMIPTLKAESGAIAKYFTPLDALQGIADEFKAADALEEAYDNHSKRAELSLKARVKSREYDWSVVNPMWYEFIEEIREETSYKPLEERKL